MKIPNICVMAPAWGRPETLKKAVHSWFAAGAAEVVVVASQDDPLLPDVYAAAQMAWISLAENRPLSNKWNSGVYTAMDACMWDYLCVLGSDDIVSPNFFEAYPWGSIGQCFGWADCYFHGDGSLYHWRGYGSRRLESIGAGRVYSRRLCERLRGRLWPPGLDRSLDYGQRQMLAEEGVDIPYESLPEGVYLVDVKDELSVSKLSDYRPKDLEKVEVPECLKTYLSDS